MSGIEQFGFNLDMIVIRKWACIFLTILLVNLGCKSSADFDSFEKQADTRFENCVMNNEVLKERVLQVTEGNSDILKPLIKANPQYEKTEWCYEYYAESEEPGFASSTFVVFDFWQNTIAIAYENSTMDSVLYLFETDSLKPMPMLLMMEEDFLNRQELEEEH